MLEYIFGLFVGSFPPDSYSASWALFDKFLGFATLTYDFTYVIGFGIVDGIFWEENLFEFFEGFIIIGWYESRMIEYVRFSHLHAILDEGDSFPDKGIFFANFPCVDSFANVVVDGFGGGRSEIGVVHGEMVHLWIELVKSV